MLILTKALLILALLMACEISAFGSPKLGETTVTDIDRKPIRVKAGLPTVIQFWASWCKSCGDTMLKLDRLSKRTKVQFMGISLDEELSAVEEYLSAKSYLSRVKRNIFWDPEAILASRLKIEAIPSIVVFDKTGRQIFRKEGQPEAQDFRHIRRIIKELNP